MASTKIPLELTAYAPDADGATLELQTTDTTVTDGSVLGKIEFKAPKEASGTDAILVGAAIEAVAEGTFAADNNATELVFKTGASEAAASKMVLTSAGNLSIASGAIAVGQSTFSGGSVIADFHTSGSGVGTQLTFANDHNTDKFYVGLEGNTTGDGFLYQQKDADINFYTNNAFRAKLDNSGNFGIGTTSVGAELHVSAATTTQVRCESTTNSSTSTFQLATNGSDWNLSAGGSSQGTYPNGFYIYDGGADATRLYITSSGDFRIGTTNDMSSKFAVINTANQPVFVADHGNNSGFSQTIIDSACSQNGGTYFFYKAQIRGIANKFIVAQDGNVTNTNNSYGSISDQRLKTDIAYASSQWDDIKALKVRKFKLGMQPDDGFKIGVVSQELEASGMNGLVQEKDADEYQIAYNSDLNGQKVKEVKYSILYMKAIKALQEAMTRIETLEAKVQTLEDA